MFREGNPKEFVESREARVELICSAWNLSVLKEPQNWP